MHITDNPKDKISTVQAIVFISSLTVGAAIITLPRSAARSVNTPDVWASILFGGLIAIIPSIILVKLSQRFPGKTCFQFNRIITGKFLGWILSFLMIAYYTLLAGFEGRMMVELVRVYLLPRTPIEVALMAFLWAGTYLTVSGINPIARAFEFYFPIVIFIFFSVLFLGLQRFELDNLRPLFGQGFKPVLRGIMTTFLTYAGFETMMILTAFMKEPWKAVKVVVIGIGISIAFYVSLSVVVVGVLTVEEIKTLAWPTIALVNSIEYPGGFVENFQVFFLIVWIFAIYTTFVSSHYIACLGLGQISNKAFNSFVYALIPIIYIVALAPQNLEEVFQLGDYIGYFGVFMGGIVPVILLFIAIIRREGCAEKQGEK